MSSYKIGIVGAAGYTGGELIRILLQHPEVEITYAQSKSNAGNKVSSIHTDLLGETDLCFCDIISYEVDVIFLCMKHGEAAKTIAEIPSHIKLIDLSQDFRVGATNTDRKFVYGLTEYNKTAISSAQNIANPGCFATAIQLALIPLAAKQLLTSNITLHCTTGATGAGQSPSPTSHFAYRTNNVSVYKAFHHQHLQEIKQTFTQLQTNFSAKLSMFPQRGSFSRGIFCCIHFEISTDLSEIKNIMQEYYASSEFVFLSEENIDLKQVVNTNKCLLYVEKNGNELMIISILDNLLKGASGQAVQNMNLMLGLKETSGLKLKATAY